MAGIKIQGTQTVDNQTGAPVLNRTQATGADFGAGVSSAVQNVATALSERIQKQADLAAMNKFKNDEYEYKNAKMNEYLTQSKGQHTLEDWAALQKDFKQWDDQYRKDNVGSRYESAFDRQITSSNQDWSRRAMAHQNTELEKFNVEQFQARQRNTIDAIGNNPFDAKFVEPKINEMLASQLAHDDAYGVSDEVKADNALSVTTAGRLSVVDQYAAQSDFKGGLDYLNQHKNDIRPPERVKYEKSLKQGLKAAKAHSATVFKNKVSNYMAALNNGDKDVPEIKREEFNALPKEQQDIAWSSYQDAVSFSKELQNSEWTTVAEDKDSLEKLNPNNLDPLNAKQNEQQYNIKAAATREKWKRISDDPVFYVEKNTPNIDKIKSEAEESGDYSNLASFRLAQQERLGVPKEQRRVLSKSEAQAYAVKFNAGGEDAISLLQGLHGRYGDANYSVVLKDLSRAGVSSGVVVLAGITDPLIANNFNDALRISDKDLKATLEKKDITATETAVKTAINNDFGVTLNGMPTAPKMIAQYEKELTHYARGLLSTGKSSSAEEAAKRAVAEVLDSQYHFVEQGGGKYRIPVSFNNEQADDLESAANEKLKELKLAPYTDFYAPQDTVLLTEKSRQLKYHAQSLLGARWVTNADDSGITLMDSKHDAVLDKNGEPFSYTWDDLSNGAQ